PGRRPPEIVSGGCPARAGQPHPRQRATRDLDARVTTGPVNRVAAGTSAEGRTLSPGGVARERIASGRLLRRVPS
ncbi:hypothetical protein, partial [Streptomyces griseus]|uniref:hypothetical protein n=1 Tax=Streptomyces griseus TaxID=1911 RepID=UPI00339E5F22